MTKVLQVLYKNKTLKVIVDAEDYEYLRLFKWSARVDSRSSRPNPYYFYTTLCGKKIELHRMIVGCDSTKEVVDHVDNDPLNNRRSNLNIGTHRANIINMEYKPSRGSSGYRNVYWDKVNAKWVVSIRLKDLNKNLGRFKCKHEAARVANLARRMYYGPNAQLNEIQGEV